MFLASGPSWQRARFFLLALLLAGCSGSGGDEPVSGTGMEPDAGTDMGPVSDTVAGADTVPDADTVADTVADTGTDAVADAAAVPAGSIAIYVKGDHSPVLFNDGMSGQTATDIEIAISRYHILTSAGDPKPELCFDHGAKTVVTNMAKDTLVGTCPTAKIPSAAYSHGRVKVDWSRLTVAGNLHYGGQVISGNYTFFRAFSATNLDGKAYAAGAGSVRFKDKSGFVDQVLPYAFPSLPQMPGVKTQTIGDEFLMTFVWTKPLTIASGDTAAHWARFHWQVFEGFRWKELTMAGYQTGIWDASTSPAASEPVLLGGVTGYKVTSSTD